jgi:hypothetical protein
MLSVMAALEPVKPGNELIESAQTRWRAVNAPHLVALVRAGAVFTNGKLIERLDGSEGGDQQVA